MTSLPLSPEVSPVVISYATSYLHCATLCLGLFCALPILNMNSIRNYTRVSKFRIFHKAKQCKHLTKSYDFLQFGWICLRILKRHFKNFNAFRQSFFFLNCFFCNMIVPLPRSCSRSCSCRATTHFVFFFWQDKSVQSRHNNLARKQNVAYYCLKRFVRFRKTKSWRRAATNEWQKRYWTRPGRTSAWCRDYFVNDHDVVLTEHLFHTCIIPGPTRFYHFRAF